MLDTRLIQELCLTLGNQRLLRVMRSRPDQKNISHELEMLGYLDRTNHAVSPSLKAAFESMVPYPQAPLLRLMAKLPVR